MRCCVPFCKNTSDNVTEGERKGISFHGFPSEVHLRAAWLRALGKQDGHLPDSAVVCSQHFLNDDIYETESGLRQIVTGAIPSTVQVCMICLDTDSKLLLINKHKLEEAYEKITGHPLYDPGNLKQTLCVQCAQRLINFSRFRDKSLRARALLMDLVEKHELITRRHIKMINRTKHQLKSNMVLTMLGPDHCDLHILEHPSEDKRIEIEVIGLRDEVKTEESNDKQTELEEFHHTDVVITEDSDDTMSVEEDLELIYSQNESAPFQCTLCLEEFFNEYKYMRHIIAHLQNGAGDGECATSQVCEPHTSVSSSYSHSSLITENKQADPGPFAHLAQISVAPASTTFATSIENKVHTNKEADAEQKVKQELETNNDGIQNTSVDSKIFTNCEVRLCDIFETIEVPGRDNTPTKTRKSVRFCDVKNIASEDFSHQATNQNEVPTTEYIEPVTNSGSRVKVIVSRTVQSESNNINTLYDNSSQYSSYTANSSLICDICQKSFKCKSLLLRHMTTHSELRPFTCKICQNKYKCKGHLTTHMKTHTGDKPFACGLCEYKSSRKSNLIRHMRAHTGIKSYACELCKYKGATKSNLTKHMKIHTDEKPYACELCEYKTRGKPNLINHIRTHTGEKPYACRFCEYKCITRSGIVIHMRTHTGENLYTCNICNRKFARSSSFMSHLRNHTGITPYPCKLCQYKFTQKGNLIRHMRIHTGEKPYSCTLCEYKCSDQSTIRSHMKTHSREK